MADRITFDFLTMQWQGITREQVDIWQRLYPDVNVPAQLKVEMIRWLDRQVITRQPLKVKKVGRKVDWKKTITNWLRKEQMKAVGL